VSSVDSFFFYVNDARYEPEVYEEMCWAGKNISISSR